MASIEKRGENTWRITVSCGYDAQGIKIRKRKTVELEPGLTDRQIEKELKRQAAIFEEEVKKGIYFEPSNFTLSDFIAKWLEERSKDLESKTLFRYKGMLNGRISKALGHLKLEQIKPLHLLEFYRSLQEIGIREDTAYMATPELKELINSQRIDIKKLAEDADITERTMKGILSGHSTTNAHSIVNALNRSPNLKVKFDKLFIPTSELKPLSNKTIQHYHRLLSVMFNDAVRWGMMRENPCLKVRPPKVIRKEMSCLDEEGISKLLECLESEDIRTQTIITLALMTGCRRSEICGLQWQHIDLEKGVINIKQAAIYTPETGIQIKQPKTASSVRSISIPGSTIQLLKQYRKWWLEQKIKCGDLWQKEEKDRQGEDWKDPEWAFATWNGYIIHPDTINDIFKKFLRRHQLPDIRLHDLRHTAATYLINAGLNVRAVAARMGHANPNVTLAVYSHALQSADKRAADVMETLIRKKKNTDVQEQA